MIYCLIKCQCAHASGCIGMASALKMCPGELIHVKVAFGSERALDDVFPLNKKDGKADSFDGERVINKTFGVPFLVIELRHLVV